MINLKQVDIEEVEVAAAKAWRDKAFGCGNTENGRHDFMVMSKMLSSKSSHVTSIMCKHCFVKLVTEDIYRYIT